MKMLSSLSARPLGGTVMAAASVDSVAVKIARVAALLTPCPSIETP